MEQTNCCIMFSLFAGVYVSSSLEFSISQKSWSGSWKYYSHLCSGGFCFI